MLIKFIGHAGISIEEESSLILVDPWFRDSEVDRAVMAGFLEYKTIDFQIPKTNQDILNYTPRGVFVSHFHPHHAYPRDVFELLENSPDKQPIFGYPNVGVEKNEEIRKSFSGIKKTITTLAFDDEERVDIDNLSIQALGHTVPEHAAWHIVGKTGSVLHIADPRAHRDLDQKGLDPAWEKFADLNPDVLFINASGNSFRRNKGGIKTISENVCLSVGEALELVRLINPKVVTLIGCYNRSVWNGIREYVRPAAVIEDEFYWGMSWVNPNIRCVFARPGHVYLVGETASHTPIDTLI